MLTQRQLFDLAARRIADANDTFISLVNCKENPLMRADLEQAIQRNPERWGRFAGFLDTLPDKRPEPDS